MSAGTYITATIGYGAAVLFALCGVAWMFPTPGKPPSAVNVTGNLVLALAFAGTTRWLLGP